MAENFPRFLLLYFLSIRSCSFNVIAAIVNEFRSPGSRGPRSDPGTSTLKSGGLGSFSSFFKAVYTAASIESLSTVPYSPKRIIVLSLETIF